MMRSMDGDLRRIETHQVQGRWQQALMPKVFNYKEDEMKINHELRAGDGEEFQPHEIGFSITVDSIGSLSETDKTKLFGQIGTLQSVSIVETRNESIEIQSKSLPELFYTSEDLKQRKTTYYAKPFESFCHENLSYMLRYLNETVYTSGLRSLYSSKTMHNTFYK